MASARTNLMTAEEFYQWANRPENYHQNCELVRGKIEELPQGGRLHGMVCANVAGVLGNYVRKRRKGYVCANNAGVITERNPDTVRGPDVMLFDDANTYEEVDRTYGVNPPLLAVEVLSPEDVADKVMERVTDLLRFGTALVWVLDPNAHNVHVYRPGKESSVVCESQEVTGEDVLSDLCCPVANLFTLPGR